jgi:arylsulfate sulfotransferase
MLGPGTGTTTAASEPVALGVEIPSSCHGGFLLDLDSVAVAGQEPVELVVECDPERRVVGSNSMISFEYTPASPHGLEPQRREYVLPRVAKLAEPFGAMEPGTVIGVAVDGVALHVAVEARDGTHWDPRTAGMLDRCNGHTGPGGSYHYHARPVCVSGSDEPGAVVGYALDGLPILVPWVYDDQGRPSRVRSSYLYLETGGANPYHDWRYVVGMGLLNECNAGQLRDGSWAYFATEEFPWGPFCFIGQTPASVGRHTGIAPNTDPSPSGTDVVGTVASTNPVAQP